jgi:hypothetical protein
VEYLNAAGEPLPEGWQIVAIDTSGAAPAAGDPNTRQIGIDYKKFEEAVPESTPGAPGKPGMVCVLLIHEYTHIKDNLSQSPCNEIKIASDLTPFSIPPPELLDMAD